MVVLLVVYLWLHFVSFCIRNRTCTDCRTCTLTAADIRRWCNFSASPPRAARTTASGSIGAQLLHISSQMLHNTRVAHNNSCTYTKLHRRAPSHDYYTLPVCAAQQPNYPLQRNIALKTLPSEILPGLGSLTIYIFRLSG